jgi:DNA-binding XRE family transcriptional regulator
MGRVRETVRCRVCELNQFMTSDGKCRRCHEPFTEPVELDVRDGLDQAPALHPLDFRSYSLGHPVSGTLPIVMTWLRLHKGHTQQTLADVQRVRRTWLTKVENGKCSPNVKSLLDWCNAVDESPSHVLYFAEQVWEAVNLKGAA